MRKIITREERERRERKNRTIIGIILVGIMILSTAGYAFYNIKGEVIEKIEYKEIEFVLKEDGLWHFEISGQEFSTLNNPKQTEDVFISGNFNLQNYAGKPLYFSYDSENNGINEIVRNIGRYTGRIQLACIDECEEDLPMKNCTDNIIIVREENETLIKQEENCIYILGKQNDIIKASDAFVFRLFGF